jgi:hypothetical protein
VIHIQIRYNLVERNKKGLMVGKISGLLLAVLGFSFLFFAVICCPFELARVSSEVQRTFLAFA